MANDPSEKDSASKPPASGAESKPVAPGAPVEKPAAPAAPAAPKAAAPPAKEAPPKPLPLDNELVQRLKARFGDAIREATLDRKQAIVTIAAEPVSYTHLDVYKRQGATGLLSAPDAGGFEAESFSERSLAIESVSTLAAGIPKAASSPPF